MRIQSTAAHAAPAGAAESLLREGRLDDALAALTARVRAAPTDADARVFLCQLLAMGGQWARAEAQLKAAAQMDPSNAVLGVVYGGLLEAERGREAVFAGEGLPTVFGEPPAWIAPLLQAALHDARGEHAAAAPLRARAFEAAPAVSGRIDGAPFAWIADADSRLGPCLELFANGGYGWAPFERIRALKFEPPQSLFDMLWAPVAITWSHGGETPGHVPVRYPGSERATGDGLRLGRGTDWSRLDDDSWAGQGQRMLATDAGDHPLLEVRRVECDAGG